MYNSDGGRRDFLDSLHEDLGGIIRSSGMELSSPEIDAVHEVFHELFDLDASGALRKPRRDFGDNYGSRGVINVMPSAHETDKITDTLVVYCLGNEKLIPMITEMLIAVGKHGFKNVIFVTSKWDDAAVTGVNRQRLQDLIDFSRKGKSFCFILKCPSRIIRIPVV